MLTEYPSSPSAPINAKGTSLNTKFIIFDHWNKTHHFKCKIHHFKYKPRSSACSLAPHSEAYIAGGPQTHTSTSSLGPYPRQKERDQNQRPKSGKINRKSGKINRKSTGNRTGSKSSIIALSIRPDRPPCNTKFIHHFKSKFIILNTNIINLNTVNSSIFTISTRANCQTERKLRWGLRRFCSKTLTFDWKTRILSWISIEKSWFMLTQSAGASERISSRLSCS